MVTPKPDEEGSGDLVKAAGKAVIAGVSVSATLDPTESVAVAIGEFVKFLVNFYIVSKV